MERLNIIDTLGPFFVNQPQRDVINWSKVIFSDLEARGRLDLSTKKRIIANFESYINKVSGLGYNSISVDDLAHLVSFPFYNTSLQNLLQDYRDLYKRLFVIAENHQMKIFVNTDYLFFNEDIQSYLSENFIEPEDFYCQVLENAFGEFPEIEGIIYA